MTDKTQEDLDFDREVASRRLAEEQARTGGFLGRIWSLFRRAAKQLGLRKIVACALIGAAGYGALGQFTGSVNNELLNAKTPEKGSAVIEWLKGSVARELDTGWGPSATVFRPSGMRIDMSAFQKGQRRIWDKVAYRLEKDVTRAGVNTKMDPDISDVRARIMLGDHYSPFFFVDSKLSTTSSFAVAVEKMDRFQKRLATGEAHIYPRIDHLSYLVDEVTSVLGDSQTRMQDVADKAGIFIGPKTREVTYEVLGVMNASCGFLRAVQKDFVKVVEYQSVAEIFPLTLEKVCTSVGDYPMPLLNWKGQVAQLDADVSRATNQLEDLQRALAAEARRLAPTPR